MRDTEQSLSPVSSQSTCIAVRVFVLFSMLSGEIYLRLKPYLVFKISSDIVTEHCCQVCVPSMMFCRSDCWLCVDMVSDYAINSSEYHVWNHSDSQTWDIKIFFTFDFHILHQQRRIGARIISCRCISMKTNSPCGPFYWQLIPSLKLLDCDIKIQNDIHIDTY